MYNLLEYSSNYAMTLESLWIYDREEVKDDLNENNGGGNYRKIATRKQVNLLSIRQR